MKTDSEVRAEIWGEGKLGERTRRERERSGRWAGGRPFGCARPTPLDLAREGGREGGVSPSLPPPEINPHRRI